MGDTDSAPKRRVGTSIFSRILFSFISPTISKAKRKGRLQEDEVPEHTMDLDTSLLFRRFDDEWQRQQKNKKPSMVKALVAGRWILIVATGVGYIVAQATTLAGPLLLKQIVAGLTCRRNEDTSSCDSEQTLYMCAPGQTVIAVVDATCFGRGHTSRPDRCKLEYFSGNTPYKPEMLRIHGELYGVLPRRLVAHRTLLLCVCQTRGVQVCTGTIYRATHPGAGREQ